MHMDINSSKFDDRKRDAGKSPQKTILPPIQTVVKKMKALKKGQDDTDKLPFIKKEVLPAQIDSGPSKKEMADLNKMRWEDETYKLAAECMKKPKPLPADDRRM
ncbi:hypothetical protein FRC11_015036 [Ceratobasidium sp. 423]|nr:hypothetical protein FRC11_015036 [Ceratobasidium sp. 423]